MQLLIEDRPDSAVEINKIIKQVFNHGEVLELLEDEEIGVEIEEACILKSSDILDNKKSLRESSPFTTHFMEILKQFKQSSNDYDINPLHAPDYINFLMMNFMPYTGIWASIGLKGTKLSRLSNGVIEKVWNFKKYQMTCYQNLN